MKILGMAMAVAALAALPLATVGTANAMPVPGVVTGSFAEGGPNAPNDLAPLGTPLYTDFSNSGSSPNFLWQLGGKTATIFGVVKSEGKPTENFKDGWTMTVEKVTEIVFSWRPQDVNDNGFKGTFFSADFGNFVFGNAPGSELIGTLYPGTEYSFIVDPTTKSKKEQFGDWEITGTVVPLPAGGILLLTALGGLAAFRARKKA